MSDASSASAAQAAPVPTRPPLALHVAAPLLLAALALGEAGRLLFDAPRVGLNVGLWCGLLIAAVFGLARAWRIRPSWESRLLLGSALLFASLFAWRDSPILVFLNFLCLATALALALPHLRAPGLGHAPISQHLLSLLRGHLVGLTGPLSVVFLAPWREMGRRTLHPAAAPFVRGALLAAPVLLVFGALLGSADAAFGTLMGGMFSWNVESALEGAVVAGFWSWLALGWLYGGLVGSPWMLAKEGPKSLRLGLPEVSVVLGSVALLFGAFLAVQGAYFFGGAAQVTALTGLTYAEYARRGFFELLAVAALVLPLLVTLSGLLGEARRFAVFRGLCVLIAVFVGVMLISASARMRLYVDAYGLTEDRVLAVTFMAWVALSLAWFVAALLAGALRRFAFGAVLLAFTTTLALNLASPARLIAEANIDRATSQDLLELAWVGADAVPVLLARLPGFDPAVRRSVLNSLASQYGPQYGRSADLRSWNFARARATPLVTALLEEPEENGARSSPDHARVDTVRP